MFTICSHNKERTMVHCNKEVSDSILLPILEKVGINPQKQRIITIDPVTYMICNSESFDIHIEEEVYDEY
jgi:hypothetical protein